MGPGDAFIRVVFGHNLTSSNMYLDFRISNIGLGLDEVTLENSRKVLNPPLIALLFTWSNWPETCRNRILGARK